MKLIQWTPHALQNLMDREIDRSIVERTVRQPEFNVDDPPGRQIAMRRYKDEVLQQEMLLRVVVEDAVGEIIVITVYKTSQIRRYLKGLVP